MKLNKLKKLLSWRLIGPLAVILVFWWAGPVKIVSILAGTNWKLMGIAVSLAIPLALIKGLRWKLLLNGEKIQIGFNECTSMYSMGMTMAAVTPGRVGDFIKVLPLMQKGCNVGKAVACNIIDRLLDVGVILLVGYLGMWYFSQYFAHQLFIVNLTAVAILCLIVVLIFRRHLIKRLAIKVVPKKHRQAVRESWKEVVKGLIGQGGKLLVWLFLCTIFFWMIQFSAAFLCAKAIGIDIPFIYFCACIAVVTVASFMPITVAGAGTRDAILIVLLAQIGTERQESVAISSLILVVYVLNCAIFFIISMCLKKKTIDSKMDVTDTF